MNLLIDARRYALENNIYFERAFDNFCDFLDHSSLTPPQVREILNEIELVNSKIHGYGSMNFGRNLQQAYRHLAEREIRAEDLEHVLSLAAKILEQPLEMIEGVEDRTLAYLSARHELTIFTKGHREEQRLKIDRSGVARFFRHSAIVKEKDAAAYHGIVAEKQWDRAKHVDDRKFTEIRYQSGAGSRTERGTGASQAYVGAGAPGLAGSAERALSDRRTLRGSKSSFLKTIEVEGPVLALRNPAR